MRTIKRLLVQKHLQQEYHPILAYQRKTHSSSNSVVINWEVSTDFKGVANPYALCNMKGLINKSTDEYICLYSLFIVRGA